MGNRIELDARETEYLIRECLAGRMREAARRAGVGHSASSAGWASIRPWRFMPYAAQPDSCLRCTTAHNTHRNTLWLFHIFILFLCLLDGGSSALFYLINMKKSAPRQTFSTGEQCAGIYRRIAHCSAGSPAASTVGYCRARVQHSSSPSASPVQKPPFPGSPPAG